MAIIPIADQFTINNIAATKNLLGHLTDVEVMVARIRDAAATDNATIQWRQVGTTASAANQLRNVLSDFQHTGEV